MNKKKWVIAGGIFAIVLVVSGLLWTLSEISTQAAVEKRYIEKEGVVLVFELTLKENRISAEIYNENDYIVRIEKFRWSNGYYSIDLLDIKELQSNERWVIGDINRNLFHIFRGCERIAVLKPEQDQSKAYEK